MNDRDPRAAGESWESQRTELFRADAPANGAPLSPRRLLEGSERYQVEAVLGQGGMGRVLRAWDSRLRRHVALKVLSGEQPEAVARFLNEAQAQARVDHPHVCKVYETGEAAGAPFIAMQLVSGPSLAAAAAELSLAAKVRVVEQVAEAVHAAHRQGLIHRDLKPGNIMLEATETSGWHPYVVDFGLAREVGAEGLTLTGVALGTPAFMSPEQAEGNPQRVDARSDVYSLGATLYAILAGIPPYTGTTAVGVILQVLGQDPVPLRRAAPGVPVDLATVVMKCLERERERRYPTALALAEDLGRFLAGEAVLARPPSVAYRLTVLTRKHRRLVAVGAVALAVAAVLAGLWLRERLQAGRQVELARRFGQEAERLEGRLRLARMAPRHDLAPDKYRLRQGVEQLRVAMAGLGVAAVGPGRSAIGAALLAENQCAEARAELEAAWAAGYRPADTAFNLGRALACLYERERAGLAAVTDPDLRVLRQRLLERELRDRAVELLGAARAGGRGDDASSLYLEAVLASLAGERDRALAASARLERLDSWRFEGKQLAGRVHLAEGDALRLRGDLESATASFGQAEAALHAALDIARSDDESAIWLCRVANARLAMAAADRGAEAEPAHAAAVRSCVAAAAADSGSADAYQLLARAHLVLAHHLAYRGDDPTAVLRAGHAACQRAVELAPAEPAGKLLEGDLLLVAATHLQLLGLDPGERLQAAVVAIEESLRLGPSTDARAALGMAYRQLGTRELDAGRDPRPSLERAAEQYRQLLAAGSDSAYLHNVLGGALTEIARYDAGAGRDPSASVELAVAEYRRALALNPAYADAVLNLGLAVKCLGIYRAAAGLDPRPAMAEAVTYHEQALALKPSQVGAFGSLGGIWDVVARYEVEHGLDAAVALQRWVEATERLRQLAPDRLGAQALAGTAHAEQGKYLLAHGQDPTAAFAAGERCYRAELERWPTEVAVVNNLGDLELYWARHGLANGRDSRPHLLRAQGWLERARVMSPSWSFPLFNLSFLHRTWAEAELAAGRDPRPEVARSLEFFHQGEKIQPGIAETYAEAAAALLVEARYLLARRESPLEAVAAARALLAAGLGANPGLPALGEARGNCDRVEQEWTAAVAPPGRRPPGPAPSRP